jgi:uncharacterized coiled-coil protein SlyX
MNAHFKTITPSLIVVALALLSFELTPMAPAVSPPPDGGYPGGNTAEGYQTLFSLTAGTYNTAVGFFSLRSDTAGSFNTAIGAGALLANTADNNTATGLGALLSNTTGDQNTANGGFALFHNSTGRFNTATGYQTLFNNTTGTYNTADGQNALVTNTEGVNNTAIGAGALEFNIGGINNTATGIFALQDNTTGGGNTAAGSAALASNTTGGDNTALGNEAGSMVTTASNVICIGASVAGANVSNSCFIGNIFSQTSSGGIGVFVNSSGKLGTSTSSRRFKEKIQPIDNASEALFALTPVSFRYKKEIDPAGAQQFGLVAEDVEKVNPDLVVRDQNGQVHSVRYDQVNTMLLNEFLKEHRKVEAQRRKIEQQETTITELRSTIAQQQEDIAMVLARLREHDSRIKSVCDQIRASKSTPQLALNTP